jgi:hypothetical protein
MFLPGDRGPSFFVGEAKRDDNVGGVDVDGRHPR